MSNFQRLSELEEKVILFDTCSILNMSLRFGNFDIKEDMFGFLYALETLSKGLNGLLEDNRVFIVEDVFREYKKFRRKLKRTCKNFSKYLQIKKDEKRKEKIQDLSELGEDRELLKIIRINSLNKSRYTKNIKKCEYKKLKDFEEVKTKFCGLLDEYHNILIKLEKKTLLKNTKINYLLNKINLLTKDHKEISLTDKTIVATALCYSIFEKQNCAILSRDLDIGETLTSVFYMIKSGNFPFNSQIYKEGIEQHPIRLYVSKKGRRDGWNELRLETDSRDDKILLEKTLAVLQNKQYKSS